MFCKQLTIRLEKKDDLIQLRPLGDIHIGNLGCDIEKFKKNVAKIAEDPNYFTIGMGDYIDNVMAFINGGIDKRWNPETIDRSTLTTEEQIDRFLELWEPIKKKTWGLLAGNHEWKTINQRRFIEDFCQPLGIDYLGRMAFVYVKFVYKGNPIRNYTVFACHGGYNGMRSGGAINRMEDIGADFEADVILMGHSHGTSVNKGIRTVYIPESNTIGESPIIWANTGTFLRGYQKGIDSYVEINPRKTKRVGTVTISFEPYTGNIFGHD